MAEVDDSTFHLTYMDGKEITFQVHEENVPSPRVSHTVGRGENRHARSFEEDRLCKMNRVQISAEPIPIDEKLEIRTEVPRQEETEKESSPEGLDKDNHFWGLYMRAQYSGYKDTEDLSGSEESLSIDENETLMVENETLANTRHPRTASYTEDKDTVIEGDSDYGCLTPHLEQTNMAITDREVRRLAREEARTKGLAQAKEKARLAKEKLAKRLSLIQATRSTAEMEQLVNQDTAPKAMEDRDIDLAQEETDGENEETDEEQKVVLIIQVPINGRLQ